MTRLKKMGCLLLAMCSLVAADAGDGSKDYRMRVPVRLGSRSSVQRLDLPATVLAASMSRDLADVRIFDAAGRPMPIARSAVAAAPGRKYALPALPILGVEDTVTVTGVSLQLDGAGRARVARVDGTVAGGSGSTTVGVLFDARAVAAPAVSLTIDADLPVAQPVTLTVEASPDLKTWRPIAEAALYRSASDVAPPVLRLGGAALNWDYLRVGWRAGSRLLAPVTIRRATLLTAGEASPLVSIAATLPAQRDAHAIDFAVPFATPIAALRVVTSGDDVIVPVRVFGRRDTEQPWTLLGVGTATRGSGAATDIALRVGGFPMMRIEADERSVGFTASPTLRIGFDPRAIAFVAAGRPPFTLAVGRTGAPDAFLPLPSLMTQAAGRPPAVASVGVGVEALRLAAPDDSGGARRQVILWAVLIVATALLAGMAAVLWRRQGAS